MRKVLIKVYGIFQNSHYEMSHFQKEVLKLGIQVANMQCVSLTLKIETSTSYCLDQITVS